MSSHQKVLELRPEVAEVYAELRARYQRDKVFKALVDLYRNVHFEPEVAAHWMARHDIETYVHETSGEFRPLVAKYEQRELEFLVQRGLKLI